MKRFFHLFVLNTKNLKVLLFVPLIIIFVLLPWLKYHTEKMYGINTETEIIILQYMHSILPFSCALLMLFSLRAQFEESGNELLRLYSGRARVLYSLVYFLFHSLLCVYLFIWLSGHYDNILIEYSKLLLESIFLSSVAVFLLVVLHSVLFPVLGLVVYSAYVFISSTGTYSFVQKELTADIPERLWIFAAVGAVLMCAAVIADNRLPRYQ